MSHIKKRTKKPIVLLLLTAVILCIGAIRSEAAEPGSGPAQAGWAEVEITPPMGLVMGGRGPTETAGKKVLDPLFAQILYLKDNRGTGFVLVSFDLHALPLELSDRIRLRLVQELGVEWNYIVLNASHTHSGPMTTYTIFAGIDSVPPEAQKYFDTLIEKLTLAARSAAKSLAPVTVEVFEGKSQIAINRRGKNKKGEPAMVPNAKGPIAEKLWILKLTPTDGKEPAIIFSYACHPVIAYGFSPSGISADWPGVARKQLRAKFGEKVHAQFVQGTAGDVRPRELADLKRNGFRSPKPDDLQRVGNDIAQDIFVALGTKAKTLQLNIAAAGDKPFLPRGNPPPREQYETLLKTTKSKGLENVAHYWLQRYDSGAGFAKGDAWPAGVIRLADNQWICCLAGEPCVEWWPHVTEWMAPRDTVVFGYCQEVFSYLPTEEMLPAGGYEVLDSNRARASTPAGFAPGINEAIRKSLIRQLSFIEAKP